MKSQEACILLFVKYPKKGDVKHRLSKTLDPELVVELYRAFVLDTLATLHKIQLPVLLCFWPGNSEEKFQSWLGSSYHYHPQEGKDLGARMKNAFIYAFDRGYRRVVLMGSDSPDLPKEFLSSAARELKNHDVVVGPSSDGGYYLIGFQSGTFVPEAFENITWSTPTVFQETLQKIQNANRSISLLPIWSDVDTSMDLKKLIKRNRDTAFKSSKTISYLRRNKLMQEDEDVEMSAL
jgi:uncharacterized protein